MRFKSALPYAPGAVLFLIESGLQVSGISNIALAVTLWGAAAILTILAAWYSLKESWMLQWPITKRPRSDMTLPPTVASLPPTLQAALYVCDIRFTFADLEKDRHSEISMRVFNGTGSVVEFSGLISGRIKFSAPNNTDPSRMGDLPTPAMRPDTERTVAQLQEWLLILTQRVPAGEADKLVAMLEADIRIHFDLSELTIGVFAQDDRNTVKRLPIWSGVSYNQEYGFGRIISGIMNAIE
jgi:hypothetical protein